MPSDFPARTIDLPREEVMVCCIKISDALRWSQYKTISDIAELLISLSASSIDLYLKLSRTGSSKYAQKVFANPAEGEQESIKCAEKAFQDTL